MAKFRLCWLSSFLLFSGDIGHAQELQGAESILAQIEAAKASPGQPAGSAAAFEKYIKDFIATSESMPPEKAAAAWYALLEKYLKIPASDRYDSYSGQNRISISSIISALPPPNTWEWITKAIDQRRPTRIPSNPPRFPFLARS